MILPISYGVHIMDHILGSEQKVSAVRLFEERTSKFSTRTVCSSLKKSDQRSENEYVRVVRTSDLERTFSLGKNSFFFFMSTLIMLFIYIQRK